MRNTENAALGKIASLETRLTDISRERDDLRLMHEQTDHELNTLRRTMTQKEEEAKRVLSAKVVELQQRIQGWFRSTDWTSVIFVKNPSVSIDFIL